MNQQLTSSTNVSLLTPSKNSSPNRFISIKPILIIALFALFPQPNPSTKPAATATTFLRAPHRDTPLTSEVRPTLKSGVSKSAFHRAPSVKEVQPIVVSENAPRATAKQKWI